ncbi:response regulator transcription factor [Variovorax sp. Sphag1AA]|uniref:response regulator transcription factor n=1 Tax=Variovorax sp. Sphag1AA TaxID=2587027 RepID=UPI00288992A3|nr:response regulator transcription factor [Variovorax sp. Sphag1AA]
MGTAGDSPSCSRIEIGPALTRLFEVMSPSSSRTPQILIVDDDEGITTLLRDYLARFGFKAHVASHDAAMQAQLAEHPIDLIVLDLMLPGTDGLALARQVRQGTHIPIIMLTARSHPYDRVLGLESGADDYMSKPFEPRELVARIHTVLRRAGGAQHAADPQIRGNVVRFDGWALHRDDRCLVSPAGLTVALSNAEFRLLSTFLQMPRRLFSRDQLMEQARGRSMESFDRSIDLLVSRLRQKLADDPREPKMIKTVRGAGYLFNVRSVQDQVAWQN